LIQWFWEYYKECMANCTNIALTEKLC
jgi:hypothetical protein